VNFTPGVKFKMRAASSRSEGGFAEGRYAAGSLLDMVQKKDSKGKSYYKYSLLVRSADNNEGGRHYLVSSAVGSDGQLYICKVGSPCTFIAHCGVLWCALL
jgi:photosystem II oxygen-evolving enhancer protein 2